MSIATLAATGLQALEARNFPLAIANLTTALTTSTSPNPSPLWLIARSKAFTATSQIPAALQDADFAVHSAYGRGDKKSIIEAHHRRAVAYNRLGELANADACCVYMFFLLEGGRAQPKDDPADAFTDDDGFWTVDEEELQKAVKEHKLSVTKKEGQDGLSQAMTPSGPDVSLFKLVVQLRTMVVRKLVALGDQDEGRKRTVKMMPPKRKLYVPDGDEKKDIEEGSSSKAEDTSKAALPKPTPAAPVAVPQNAELTIQSYESDTIMNATIFSKGVSKDLLQVHFTPSTVALNPMKYPGGVERECVISLTGTIKPNECSYRVTPSKVELKLVKAEGGKWESVGEQGVAPPAGGEIAPTIGEEEKISVEATPAPGPQAAEASKPTTSYPTSSKSGPKNWDKVVDLEDQDDEEGKDVNDFFKKLYKDATPEMQRAMMKSFTESNGTSLSTNWDEVGKGKVETVPPEGVEAKKW